MRGRPLGYALLALLALAGCKSSETSDAGPASEAGPTSCGDAVCPVGELCVGKQSCGALMCNRVPDGGVCPAGTSATPSCPDGGPPGCIAGCPEAQFSCEAKPGGCDPVSCACAVSLCSPGTCIATMGSRVACAVP